VTIAPVLDGRTRVLAIIGDPIAQVKSPAGVTRALAEAGRNAVVLPIQVTSADVDAFIRGFGLAKNVDGIIATIPHKFAAYAHCASATERAHFLAAVNTLRRNPDGSWHGDAVDGVGFVDSMHAVGADPRGKRALVVGAGGAGSAIALALLDAGASALAIHDADAARRDALIARLASLRRAPVGAGSDDPRGFEVVVNATPAGMRAGDPLPVQVGRLAPTAFAGDVITAPAVTPFIEAARRLGCVTQVGGGMFEGVMKRIVAFLLEAGPLAGPEGAAASR
jgi:shikimate dehydrogenase